MKLTASLTDRIKSFNFKKIIQAPLYPLLFTWYSILFFYSINQEGVTISVLIWPLLISLLVIGLVTIGINAFFKDWHKSALLVTVAAILFFLYSHLVSLFANFSFDLGAIIITPQSTMLLLYLIIFGALWHWLSSDSRSAHGVAIVLNSITSILLIVILFGILPVELGRAISNSQSVDVSSQRQVLSPGQSKLSYQPDIYYLIFDRYAGYKTLKDFYNYDNKPFLSSLEDRGFYVAYNSHTNYPRTIFSLSSSTNMNYLQEMIDMESDNLSEATTLKWLFSNNVVGQNFKDKGYNYYHYGNWYDLAREIDIATNVLPNQSDFVHHNNFSTKLLNTTLYSTVMHQVLPDLIPAEWNTQHRLWAEFQVDALSKAPDKTAPKFVMGHVLMPHEPFVFDAECNQREVPVAEVLANPEDYRDQLACTNQMIAKIVDAILEKSANPPIIIVQADEGPADYAHRELPSRNAFEDAPIGSILERTRILNAYYFPDGDYSQLYQSITPVNSFRTVFRQYFDMDLPNLEDKTYLFPSEDDKFNFIDATDRIREAEGL